MATDPATPSPRRFLRLSLRGVAVVVLLIATAFGWIIRRAHVQRDAVAVIKKAGGTVFYDMDPSRQIFSWKNPSSWKKVVAEHLGIDFAANAYHVETDSNTGQAEAVARVANLDRLKILRLGGLAVTDGVFEVEGRMNHLERLRLDITGVSDEGLAHARALKSLRELYIYNTLVGDDGLKHLEGLTNLKYLTLWETRVTDAGLRHLKGLNGLTRLSLCSAQVTDDGLAHLKGLTNLRILGLRETKVTDDGKKELERALPSLKIIR